MAASCEFLRGNYVCRRFSHFKQRHVPQSGLYDFIRSGISYIRGTDGTACFCGRVDVTLWSRFLYPHDGYVDKMRRLCYTLTETLSYVTREAILHYPTSFSRYFFPFRRLHRVSVIHTSIPSYIITYHNCEIIKDDRCKNNPIASLWECT